MPTVPRHPRRFSPPASSVQKKLAVSNRTFSEYGPYPLPPDVGGPSSAAYSARLFAEEGMVGYWRLDELAGPTAYDVSGGGHHMTQTGGPSFAQGRLLVTGSGRSIRFDGVDDGLAGADPVSDFSFPNLSPFSMLAWFRTGEALPASSSIAFGTGRSYFLVHTTPRIRARRTIGTTVISTSDMTTNTTYFWAMTYDGSTNRLYVNGSLDASATESTNVTGTTERVAVGRWAGGDFSHTSGTIAEAAIFNVALDSATISDLYDLGTGTV